MQRLMMVFIVMICFASQLFAQDISGSATVTASSTQSGYSAASANDDNTSNYWQSTTTFTDEWLEFDFGSDKYEFTGYKLYDAAGNPVSEWQIQGSNDGSSWTQLDSQTGQSYGTPSWSSTYSIAPSGVYYRYFRIYMTDCSFGSPFEVAEVEIYGNLQASNSSDTDIIEKSGFTYPTNIDYASYQSTDITLGNSVQVAGFTIRDGGAGTDTDALSTTLTAITFDVTNSGNLRRVALYNSSDTEVAEVAAGATVTFSGISVAASDNSTADFYLRATFNSSVTDNQQFDFAISSVTADGGGSDFAAADGGGATSSTAGDNNKIEVTATKLSFSQQPSDGEEGVQLGTQPKVDALDGNDNKDLDYTETVTLTNSGGLGQSNNTVAAVSGTATFTTYTINELGASITIDADQGALTTGTSSAIDIAGNSDSDVIATGGFTYPTNIDYASYQATDITGANGLDVFGITIRDGGGSDVGSTSTTLTDITFTITNSTYLRKVALYTTGGAELGEMSASGSITFSGLSQTAADDGTLDLVVKATFNSTVTDNDNFQFTVALVDANTSGSTFAAANGGGATSSTAGDNNKIEVTATKLSFSQQPSDGEEGVQLGTQPKVDALDGNDNKDLDYTETVTLTNSGGLGQSNNTIAAVAGTATFTNYTINEIGTNITIDADQGALTTGTSSAIDIAGNDDSDVIATGGFTYPTNIDYASYQATDITGANGLDVFGITIRDGAAGSDVGSTTTTLTDITFTITNSTYLRKVALYTTGGAELGEMSASGSITFSGLSQTVADNGTLDLVVKATFNSTVTDNDNFQFTVALVDANTNGSTFATADGGGATSSTAGDNNKIEVTATDLNFDTQPSNGVAGVALTTQPKVEAVDGNGNRDLDYTETVTIANSSGLAESNNTQAAVSGLATFANYTVSELGTNLTLSGTQGALGAATSNTFDVTGSNNSDIIEESGYSYTTNIDYTLYQSTDITSGNSVEAAGFTLRDGGAGADTDALTTTITAITFDVTNSGNLRKIALYDNGGTELGEVNAGATATFSGLSIQAADNGSVNFKLRVTYGTSVTDNQQNQFTVNSVTAANTGSVFAAANGGGASSSTAGDNNKIEVTATKLSFSTQPGDGVAGVALTTQPVVDALDDNDNKDLDYTSTVTLTNSGTLNHSNNTKAAVSGTATFANYTISELGTDVTLTASQGALTDATSNTIDITGSQNSDIIANTGFSYPTNIDYTSNQEATDLLVGNSLEVAQFDIRDGGGAADNDALTTTLTDITFQIGNYENIRRIALYDGVTELSEQAVSSNTITFSGLTVQAADDGTKTFSVRVSFNATVTDNEQFSFTVTSATADATGSSFTDTDAGGASSSTAGDNNRIEVTATKLAFSNVPTTAERIAAFGLRVSAVDANDNTDLDNTASVTLSLNSGIGNLSSATGLTQSLVSGAYDWTDLKHDKVEIISLAAATGGLTNATSSNINITADDEDPPVNADTYPKLLNTTTTTTDLNCKISENGTVYFVIVNKDETTPTSAQVKAGKNGNGIDVSNNLKGNFQLTVNTVGSIQIQNLTPRTFYDLYVVAEDFRPNVQTNPTKIRFQTTTAVTNKGDQGSTGDDGKSLTITLDENNDDPSNNYLILYTVGEGDDGPGVPPTGESLPSGYTQRVDLYWGVKAVGTVQADLIFDYSSIPNIVDPYKLRLLKRNDADDAWIDISHLAVHDVVNKRFIVYNQTTFSEFTIAANPAFGGALDFNAGYPDISEVGGPDFTLKANLTKVGIAYYLVVESGKPDPASTGEIKNPNTYPDDYVASGSINVPAIGTEYIAEVTGLQSSTGYKVFMYASKTDDTEQTTIAKETINTGNGVPLSDWIVPIILLLVTGMLVYRFRFRMS